VVTALVCHLAAPRLLCWDGCTVTTRNGPFLELFGFVSAQLYSKTIAPAFTLFEETVCFYCYRLLIDCYQRETNRAAVTPT